jgi:ankyrin repeat protein
LTALHVAAAADDSEATRLLLEHGADPEAKSPNGLTPLDMARRANAAKTVTLLETRTK